MASLWEFEVGDILVDALGILLNIFFWCIVCRARGGPMERLKSIFENQSIIAALANFFVDFCLQIAIISAVGDAEDAIDELKGAGCLNPASGDGYSALILLQDMVGSITGLAVVNVIAAVIGGISAVVAACLEDAEETGQKRACLREWLAAAGRCLGTRCLESKAAHKCMHTWLSKKAGSCGCGLLKAKESESKGDKPDDTVHDDGKKEEREFDSLKLALFVTQCMCSAVELFLSLVSFFTNTRPLVPMLESIEAAALRLDSAQQEDMCFSRYEGLPATSQVGVGWHAVWPMFACLAVVVIYLLYYCSPECAQVSPACLYCFSKVRCAFKKEPSPDGSQTLDILPRPPSVRPVEPKDPPATTFLGSGGLEPGAADDASE